MRRSRIVGLWLVAALSAAAAWGLSVSVVASPPRSGVLERASVERGTDEPVVVAYWGSRSGEAGVSHGLGETRGPLSFAVDDLERVWLLDQQNGRMTCYDDGRPVLEAELPDSACEDITAARDRLCVLSQGTPRRVHVFDDRGALIRSIVIPAHLPPILHVMIDKSRILVECPDEDGRTFYDVGSLTGGERAAERALAPTRRTVPLPASRAAHARIGAAGETIVDLEHDAGPVARIRAHGPGSVRSILDLAGDTHGSIFLTTVNGEDDERTAFLTVQRFTAGGERSAMAGCEYTPFTDAVRRVVVTASGDVYRMDSGPTGIRIVRWRLSSVEGGGSR